MADRQIDYTATFKVKDELTPAAEAAADALDRLESKGDVEVEVEAPGADETAEQVDEVGTEVEDLDGVSAEVDVQADADDATEAVEGITSGVEDLDGSTAAVAVEADGDDAQATVADVSGLVDQLDGSTADVVVVAEADTDQLDAAAEQLDSIDGSSATATATVEADTGAIDQANQALDEFDGREATATVKVEDDGTAAAAMQGLAYGVNQLDGGLGTLLKQVAKMSPAMAGAAGGIGLVAYAGIEATDAFVELGRAAEVGGQKVGLSTEDYSRWIAVADDVGAEAGDVEAAFIGMNKKIAAGGAEFEKYGVKTEEANGKVRNSSDVLADVLGVLSQIEDPAERAAVGTELLGKGYKALAPLVGDTTDAIKENLAAVSDAQVIGDSEAQTAKDMALAQDNLADAFADVGLKLGGALAKLAPLVDGLANLTVWITDNSSALIPFSDGLANGRTEIEGMASAIPGLTHGLQAHTTSASEAAEAAEELARKHALVETTSKAAEDASKAYTDQLEAQKTAHEEAAQAAQEQSDAMRAAADAGFAVTSAQAKFNDTYADLGESLKDVTVGSTEYWQILNEVSGAAADVADAQVRVAEETAAAKGETVSATQKLDMWNHSMLEQASSVTPQAREAMLHYIATVNDIPPEKETEILALINAGDLAGAQALLDEASANRTATLTADAETGKAKEDLDLLAKWAETNHVVIAPVTDPKPFIESLTGLLALGDDSTTTVGVGADPQSAHETIGRLEAGTYHATVDVDAPTDPATNRIKAAAGAKYPATITAAAETAQAALNLLALISQTRRALIVATVVNANQSADELQGLARPRVAPINVQVTNAQSVENQLAQLARPRSATIQTTVQRTEVLTRVDGGG